MILEESEIRARNVFGTIQTIATMTSTLALTMNLSWPFVTLPKFEAWAGGLSLALTGAESFSFGVFVSEEQRGAWANYSQLHATAWIEESVQYYKEVVIAPSSSLDEAAEEESDEEGEDSSDDLSIHDALHTPVLHYVWKQSSEDGSIVPDYKGRAAVNWQMTPVAPELVNHNDLEKESLQRTFRGMEIDNQMILTDFVGDDHEHSSFLLQPVFQTVEQGTQLENDQNAIVGYSKAKLPWDSFFHSLLPQGQAGIQVVVKNPCNRAVTYQLDGPIAYVIGEGDQHYREFEDMGVKEEFDPLQTLKDRTSGCEYEIAIYPAEEYHAGYKTNKPALYSTLSVLILLFAAGAFMVYDRSVQKRQEHLISTANRSNAIVNSLFPANVRDRLLAGEPNKNNKADGVATFRDRLAGAFSSEANKQGGPSSKNSKLDSEQMHRAKVMTKPIADLFPSVTVLFADISGFMAWSSAREPSQVFTLLETVYHDAFNQIAKRRGVFKVETIGDCYVAAVGLPTPRPDHAIVMTTFARRCMDKMRKVVTELEVTLGPGTGELGMRFGIHSGSVMAGVLRGEKSRFQLFGDTVNTASRIEQTGAKNQIHLSSNTAKLLKAAGKSSWVRPRNNLVTAKGKGTLQTYWLDVDSDLARLDEERVQLERSNGHFGGGESEHGASNRLVDFNTEVLVRLLQKMAAMREGKRINKNSSSSGLLECATRHSDSGLVIDEVKEIIVLPSEPAKYNVDPETIELPPKVTTQLRHYVKTIASMYRRNPFHSFDHACHVTMSITKLLSRVVTPDTIDYDSMKYTAKAADSTLHEFTYGITSDPLTQFAVAFSALIHDVDHQGVPNVQLVKEEADIAKEYRNQSVAEQNSVDLAWELLMEPSYVDLRQYIYVNQDEHDRFRQLVVNAVMATDIMDSELGQLRRRRWDKAFNPDTADYNSTEKEQSNRKATIVIEHLIQASDVAHTMQHWHVYVKWNKRLFNEMYTAYINGRGATDPSVGWYEGEIGFFDFYIIPLAKKLQECGVFGVSSEEYLDYAEANRSEWESKGRDLVKEYLQDFHKGRSNADTESRASSNEDL